MRAGIVTCIDSQMLHVFAGCLLSEMERVMFKMLIRLVFLGAVSTLSQSQSENDYANCTSDYDTLERALMSER